MGVGTIVEAVGDDLDVGLEHSRLLAELAGQEVDGLLQWTVEQPEDKAQSEDVTATGNRLGIHAAVGQRGLGRFGDRHRHNLHDIGQSHLQEGVFGLELGFLQTRLDEGVLVVDEDATFLQVLGVLLEGSRIHGHQHIALITRRIDLLAHMHLIRRNAGQRTYWSTHLGRIVWECTDLVTQDGCHGREDGSRQLHAVSRVTREADYHFGGLNNLWILHCYFVYFMYITKFR